MILCIDIGNSLIKCSLFAEDGSFMHCTSFPHSNWSFIHRYPKDFPSITEGILCDVNGISDQWGFEFPFPMHTLTHQTPLPFSNQYKTPETLGMDRVATVAGAQSLFPGEACLVIDIGTCITFDLLNINQEYLGGSISPGTWLRFKSLNAYTGKLPLVNPEEDTQVLSVGRDTEESIIAGVQEGTKYEIEGRISEYLNQFGELNILLCGGGRNDFVFNPKLKIFAYPNLLAKGLRKILKYNDLQAL